MKILKHSLCTKLFPECALQKAVRNKVAHRLSKGLDLYMKAYFNASKREFIRAERLVDRYPKLWLPCIEKDVRKIISLGSGCDLAIYTPNTELTKKHEQQATLLGKSMETLRKEHLALIIITLQDIN
jgi:hypothetical protein